MSNLDLICNPALAHRTRKDWVRPGGQTIPEFFDSDEALHWSLIDKIVIGDRLERAYRLLAELRENGHASLLLD